MKVRDQVRHPENNGKLIISIYDYTGNWARPYIRAGYPVFLWDKEHEGDICEGFAQLMADVEAAQEAYPGLCVHGLLAAPPCTAITKSSNRYWNNRYLEPFEDEEDRAIFENLTVLSTILVEMALLAVQVFKPKGFWALENPPGRIETLVPAIKPYRRMMFHPCDYGDPYKKATVLWGEFNKPIETPVLPLLNNHIRDLGNKKTRARLRSATPPGFTHAFFKANP